MTQRDRIAVVGAGVSGLRLAQRLSAFADVEVFEKSRGLGGRMSTRRATGHQFDHGAQYFTARGQPFRDFLKPYLQEGIVQRWDAEVAQIKSGFKTILDTPEPWYVAVPGMTALCKAMAGNIDISRDRRVETLTRDKDTWRLGFTDGAEQGGFNWVFSSAPAPQTSALLPDLTDWSLVTMHGCYSLMLGFDAQVSLSFDAATVDDSPIAWIANNNSKPGRAGSGAILVQSDHEWADEWMEADQQLVQDILSAAVGDLTGVNPRQADYVSLHRWRYARVGRPMGQPFLLDLKSQCGACGDWCIAGRVEAAFDSAEALSDAVLAHLQRDVA